MNERSEAMNDTHDQVADDSPSGGGRRQIGILLFDGVEELDAVGPWEVLSAWTRQHPEDGWDAFCLSSDGRPVRAAKTLVLGAHHSIDDAPAMDVLVHPGGPGTRPMLHDRGHLDWVRRQRATVALMASVCTGSLVYAAAGLLIGRRATTHWASLNLLSELDPTIVTDVSSRFVDDGDLITSAGVSAGIDMALHLVARLTDVERAREVRREIQYNPLPPI
jgi:transcriptional regulator GlxA family with amidase domain